MSESENAAEHLLVTITDQSGCIKVITRGTFKISGALKQFGTACIEKDVDRLVLDLSQCVGMDSTFMGVIAGLAFKLRQKNDGKIYMIGLSARTRSLLSTLGLDELVEPFMAGSTPDDIEALFSNQQAPLEAIDEPDATPKETTELMLEAHSTLVDLSPENHPKFKDVLTFLKEDLERAEQDEIS